MNRTFVTLVSVAMIGLSSTVAYAAEPPLAPHVNFIATPANQLELGMTAHDVIGILGEAAKETDFAIGTGIRKLEFADPIQGQVILTDGKLSRISLDPFRGQAAALPSFVRRAWLGVASSVVRRVLGEPAAVLRHEFFGIEVDQWIYPRPGEAEASVFFRADRVIARVVGRGIPSGLLCVELPSPPDAGGEGPLPAAHVGMLESDLEVLYGAPLYRVDYVFNGQNASHAVYKAGKQGMFAGFTVVDGVVTALEDLGRMPDDPAFQGR